MKGLCFFQAWSNLGFLMLIRVIRALFHLKRYKICLCNECYTVVWKLMKTAGGGHPPSSLDVSAVSSRISKGVFFWEDKQSDVFGVQPPYQQRQSNRCYVLLKQKDKHLECPLLYF